MAAPTEVYVDPSIAADSGTGTIGDPFGDLQYALNNTTRDTANGNRFNIKAGTDEVLAAGLDLTTYGTPLDQSPLIIRGYTSAAGDGGVGGINCNSVSCFASAPSSVHLIDMHIHGAGAATILTFSADCVAVRCEIDNTTGNGILTGVRGGVFFCHVHNIGGLGINASNLGAMIYDNYLANGTNDFSVAIELDSYGHSVLFNVIDIDGSSHGIKQDGADGAAVIAHNSVYSNGGTGLGIQANTSRRNAVVINNIVEGFSGTGGMGIFLNNSSAHHMIAAGNRAYNNTTNLDINDVSFAEDNDTLGASPFADAANDDFTVGTAVKGVGWPTANYPGLSVRTHLDIGALQREEAAAGNTARARYLMGIS